MSGNNALRIIVVEDEPELRDNILIGLSAHGFDVRGVSDAPSLFDAIRERPADIVVLDLGLPGEDGIQVAKRLKDKLDLGIIMVTARGMLGDRILGLDSGADNYFVKPINIAELAAAAKNLGRRLARSVTTSWNLNVQVSSLQTPNKKNISLTSYECSLLKLLFEHLGSNVSRDDIFSALGMPDDICSNPRLEVLISRLRSKVRKADPEVSLPLLARHNIGYIFLAEDNV